jgi:hypothetical protein
MRLVVRRRIEIVRQIHRIEFALDRAVATEQTTVCDAVPLPDEMRRDQHCFATFRFVVEHFLQAFPPTGIEAQSWFIEQQNPRVGEQEEREPESLACPARKRTGPDARELL